MLEGLAVPVECDARLPLGSVAEPVSALAIRDLHGEARAGGGFARLLAADVHGARQFAAVLRVGA